MKKLVSAVAALCIVMGMLAGCSSTGGGKKAQERPRGVSSSELQLQTPAEGAANAVIDTSLGEIRVVLYPDKAPMAVENFFGLAQRGYYNGVVFHRVVKDFMVQAGDATGTGTGGSTIWNDTPFSVELSQALHHFSGALCMAHPDSNPAGNLSQFYVVQTSAKSVDKAQAAALLEQGLSESAANAYRDVGGAPYLDGTDTVFGQVYKGMDVVDAIAAAECGEDGRPLTDIIINSITVGTYSAEAEAQAEAAASAASASAQEK